MKVQWVLIVGLFASPTDSIAQTVRDVLLDNEDAGLVKLRVASLADGMGWANSYFSVNGGQRAFCPPSKLAITSDQHVDIVRRFIDSHPDDGSRMANQLGYVVLKSLIDAFPCN